MVTKKKNFFFFFFPLKKNHFHYALWDFLPHWTRMYVKLLGPCFKTGRIQCPLPTISGITPQATDEYSMASAVYLIWDKVSDLSFKSTRQESRKKNLFFYRAQKTWRWLSSPWVHQDKSRLYKTTVLELVGSAFCSAISDIFQLLTRNLFNFPSRYLFAIGVLY